jgi:hypothetical protein
MKEPIKYDSSKNYTWKEETTFHLTGGEFGLILNTLRAILTTPEARNILLANKSNEVLETLIAKAVEAGEVVEASQPPMTK